MTGGYHSARDLKRRLELSCDVVVVGSGAGGATVATELAESGLSVIVLEEGPNVSNKMQGEFRPSESLRHVWRDGGTTVTAPIGDSPAINVTMGRAVGGSSILTGGVCFRIPENVLSAWERDHGLSEYTYKNLEPYFERVEKRMHITQVPESMRSRSTVLFGEGLLKKKGVPLEPLMRNTGHECNGCGRCNFGCPEGAKMSVDKSYLPFAVEHGAQVFSHCQVDKVMFRGRRAVGVKGRILNRPGGKRGDELVVHAKRVVISTSAWHTPVILKRSGIKNRALGKRMTLHPGFRMMARFKDPVEGWKGALQSAFTEAFEGTTLVSLFVPVSVVGATMPGVGKEHVKNARRIPHIAMFGGMIHDRGAGVVRTIPGQKDPIVTYKMPKEDRAMIPKILRALGGTFLEAGAEEVYPPVLGLPSGLDADAFNRFEFEKVPGRRFEATSQHPLGTTRMGTSEKVAVTDADGRVFGVEELYVADGGLLPTSLGVNPQQSIMSVATRVAHQMRERRLRR